MTTDPFHSVRHDTKPIISSLVDIADALPDHHRISSMAIAGATNGALPLRDYKAIRIAAMHLWMLTSKDTPNSEFLLGSLAGSALTSLDKVCQAFALHDIATSSDVEPIQKEHQLSSPVRAEMFQNLSSSWEPQLMDPNSPFVMPLEESIPGTSLIDPASPNSYTHHKATIPMLIPYNRDGSIAHGLSWIPLAWTWDPYDLSTPKVNSNYANGYSGLTTYPDPVVIHETTSRSVTIKPMRVSAMKIIKWKYAIVTLPAQTGPTLQMPEPLDRFRMNRASTGGGAFAFSSLMWKIARIHAATDGLINLPHEDIMRNPSLFWGADAPLLARHLGESNTIAKSLHHAIHTRLATGNKTSFLNNTASPTMEPNLAAAYGTLRTLWGEESLPYGPWGALSSGLRYLILAWRLGHIVGRDEYVGKSSQKFWDNGTLLAPTTIRMQELMKMSTSKREVRAHRRSGKHAGGFTVKPHMRKFAPNRVVKFDMPAVKPFLTSSDLTNRDISSARDILVPSIAVCLSQMIDRAMTGNFGPHVQSWIGTVLDTAEIADHREWCDELIKLGRDRNTAKTNACNYAGEHIHGVSI